MNAITWIAEQKIMEAILAGELDNLPGAGKPLKLEDDWGGQPVHRLAHKVLKNAGFLPVTLLLRKEVEDLLAEAELLLQNCRERTAPLRPVGKTTSDSKLRSYNHLVQTFRANYHEILMRINEKITELRYACIRDELLNSMRCAAALELPLVNVSARLQNFDGMFPKVEM